MFNNLPHPLDDIMDIMLVLSGLIVVMSYAWSQWRKGKSDADSSTIQTYRSEVDALTIKMNRFEQDNKDLAAQVNQLIGENNTLKQTLTYQDPAFKLTIKTILDEIKAMRQEFKTHTKMDNKRFTDILSVVKGK